MEMEQTTPFELHLLTNIVFFEGKYYFPEDKISPQITEKKFAVIEKGKEDKITLVPDLAIDVEAPIEKNQVLGTVSFMLEDKEIGKINLCSPEAVKKLTFPDYLVRFLTSLCR